MTTWLDQLQQLSAAEDFFETLNVSYDPAVLRVVRLHVLQRFNTYIQQAEGLAAMDETSGKALCAKGRAAPELVYHPDRLLKPATGRTDRP